MNLGDIDIKSILLRGNYVTEQDLTTAAQYAESHHSTLLEYLFSQGVLTKDLVGQAVAEAFGVTYADLNTNIPAPEQILKIPEGIATKLRVVLASEDANKVVVTTDNPAQKGLVETLAQFFPGKTLTLAYSLPEDVESLFINYRKPLVTRFAQIIAKSKRVAPDIITEIFEDALVFRASDIHIEPHESDVVVRFRIDGLLHESGRIPGEYYENILNRIKVQAKLRTDEHVVPQDGALQYKRNDGEHVDMRISIVPTLDGEKVVIRLLSQYIRSFGLTDLGLSQADHNVLLEAAKKPYGMILVTGPTGSGKTTTLYALLNIINRPELNATTIEDPIEYKIATINQIQVNEKTNLTFARGLRSILRQDPNLILVGEIRDQETAEIAVNAALTGHLLFSTFHANDAATAIPRLLDIGIEPFIISSTLELVVAQRLVRKLCESCRYSMTVERDVLQRFLPNATRFFPDPSTTLYASRGCKSCHQSGYLGRVAAFELLPISKDLKELILKHPTSEQIWEMARTHGAHSMFEDGIEKVKNGVTTIEELLRVVPAE